MHVFLRGSFPFRSVPVLLEEIPYGFLNQFIDPPVFIHRQVGQLAHEGLIQPHPVVFPAF